MRNRSYSNLFEKLASLVGVASAVVLIGLPVGAQSQRTTNPNPSIFNEPPYNRAPRQSPSATPSASPAEDSTSQTAPDTPSPDATSPTTPDTPSPDATPSSTTPSTPPQGSTNTGSTNVVALAESNGSFKTLTAALKAAGLAETLQGAGPFTVFAPTDQAFAELPPEALKELLQPQNKAILVKILQYHVVSGNVTSSQLKSGEVKSVEGGPITVKVETSGVMVNDAKVVQPDLQASNGVVHVIDKVILPPDI